MITNGFFFDSKFPVDDDVNLDVAGSPAVSLHELVVGTSGVRDTTCKSRYFFHVFAGRLFDLKDVIANVTEALEGKGFTVVLDEMESKSE